MCDSETKADWLEEKVGWINLQILITRRESSLIIIFAVPAVYAGSELIAFIFLLFFLDILDILFRYLFRYFILDIVNFFCLTLSSFKHWFQLEIKAKLHFNEKDEVHIQMALI